MRLETPGGIISTVADCRDGRCERVTIDNVASFVTHLDAPVEVSGLGTLNVDIAYGGAFFALVDAPALGFSLRPDEARDLVEAGELIKAAVAERYPVVHPENAAIKEVTFTQFAAPVVTTDGLKSARNAVVISPGKIDRSPCGTGTCARMAVLHARSVLALDEPYRSVSLIGSEFQARVVKTAKVGAFCGIIPRISGRAWITGIHQYMLDPDDPFPQGYTLADTWYRTL